MLSFRTEILLLEKLRHYFFLDLESRKECWLHYDVCFFIYSFSFEIFED